MDQVNLGYLQSRLVEMMMIIILSKNDDGSGDFLSKLKSIKWNYSMTTTTTNANENFPVFTFNVLEIPNQVNKITKSATKHTFELQLADLLTPSTSAHLSQEGPFEGPSKIFRNILADIMCWMNANGFLLENSNLKFISNFRVLVDNRKGKLYKEDSCLQRT